MSTNPGLDKDKLLGTKFPPFSFPIERGKVREFCLAIGENNPIFLDLNAAKEAGFSDIPIPPTFQTAIIFWGCPTFFQDINNLGIDMKRLLHMKEEYKYHKPIYPGVSISAQMQITDVKTGKMDMVTFEAKHKDAKSGDLYITAAMTIVLIPQVL